MRLTSSCGRLAALSVFLATPARAQRPVVLPEPHVAEDVAYLASDALGGRLVGTPGADSAAEYIARRFAKAGLQRPQAGWFQEFPVSPESQQAQKAGVGGTTGRNVIGLLPGRDKKRRDEVIVVGAHYDHLGGGLVGALDPDSAGRPHNGADDNASGVVTILEVARLLRQGTPPKRTVLFVAFTGEELGGLGTRWYLRYPAKPLEATVANFNVEMTGRPDSLAGGPGRAWLTGYERSNMGEQLAAMGIPIVPDPRPSQNFFQRSDNFAFALRGIVAHTLSTFNLHADYHRPGDAADKADVTHMAQVIEAAARAVRILADGPKPEWKPGGRPERR